MANWRRAESSVAQVPARRRRVARIAAGLVAALACYAIGLEAATWFVPFHPVGLYVVRAGYLRNLAIPPNVAGLESAEAVAALGSASTPRGWFSSWSGGFGAARAVDLVDNSPWNQDLPRVAEATVVVYMTGQAGADGRGAFLYQDDKDALDWDEPSATGAPVHPYRLYIEDVVDHFLDAGRGGSRRFLLVLDVAKVPAIPALGMLRNDFDEALVGLETRLAGSGRVVLLAPTAPPGARPRARSGRGTAFGRAFVAGLRGAGLDRSGRVDSEGLVEYLRTELAGDGGPDRGVTCLPRGARPRLPLALADPGRPAARPPGDAGGPGAPRPAFDPEPWEACRRLADLGAASVAPHLWRRYRDTLLRYDELGRLAGPGGPDRPAAGGGTATAVATAREGLKADLRDLGRALAEAQTLKLAASSRMTLAMPAAEGVAPASPADWKEPFALLQVALKAGEARPVADRDRLPFYDLLIRRVEADPAGADLAPVEGLLDRLRVADQPRPAEAHFLKILLRDRPPGLFDSAAGREHLAEALRVRRMAERVALGLPFSDEAGQARRAARLGLGLPGDLPPGAYAHVEQVAPRVAGVVADGDGHRRLAEDLLFATDPGRWEEARRGLARARARYREAEDMATQSYVALVARDQAFADLPYLADWAARRPDFAAAQASVKTIEETWAAAHELADLLGSAAAADVVAARAGRVVGGLAALRAAWDDEVAARRSGRAAPAARDAFLALLDSPLLDVAARKDLFARLPAAAPAGADARTDLDRTQRAGRVGRLALAHLGRSWVDAAGVARSASPESFGDLQARLGNIEAGLAAGGGVGGDLDRLGDRIGRSRRLIPAAIRQKAEASRREGFRRSLVRLGEVDRLGRMLIGGQRAASPAGAGPEPTAAYRHRLLQVVLLEQARRTLDGHWFGEDDEPPASDDPRPARPYYQAVAGRFRDDLEGIGDIPEAERAPDGDLARIGAALAEPGRLIVRGPPGRLVVSDEPNLQLCYRIEAPTGTAATAEGRPVVWIDPGDGRQVRLDAPAPGARQDVPIDPPSVDADHGGPIPRTGPARGRVVGQVSFAAVDQAATTATPRVDSGRFHFEGRYRGQKLREEVAFEVHPIPEILVRHDPPPPTGGIAVIADPALIARAGGVEEGALVIVLDCSGSMGPDPQAAPGAPSKYREAVAAIRQLLGRVAQGTRVSLWAFGEAYGPARRAARPEETILQVLRPTTWRAADRAQVDDLIRRIEPPALEPYNESPLVATMLAAQADFRGVAGFKSMVVLTDGMDNCFGRDRAAGDRAGAEIGPALDAAFRGSGVEINVVSYKARGAEGGVARQLEAIRSLSPPGRFYTAGQADQLAGELARGLKPSFRYSVRTVDNIPIREVVEPGAGPDATPHFRALETGHYKLVAEAEGWSERPITIKRGDKLIVQLAEGGQGVAMDRVTWTDTLPRRPATREVNDWRLAALQSRLQPPRGLTLWASLERLPDPREAALEMIRPEFLWLEVRPQGNPAAPFQQRWHRTYRPHALAWEVEVPAWPDGPRPGEPARPRVTAYWDPRGRGEPIVSLTPADFRSIVEVRDRRVATPRGTVVIESIRAEPVRDAQGRDARGLVVRLSHDSGLQFLARPTGILAASVEHRLYTRAGKYTGAFGPLTDDQIEQSVTGLELISLDDFRKQAAQRGFAVEDLEADPPTPDDRGPDLDSTPVPLPPPGARRL